MAEAIAITNVNVFDGNTLSEERTVVIEAGRRADLLLIEGDPIQDIIATRAIRSVWVAGVQVR